MRRGGLSPSAELLVNTAVDAEVPSDLVVVCASFQRGFTPLHIATKYGHLKVVRLLLAKGIDPNVEGKNCLTALHVATHYNHVAIALYLLEKGASPHCATKV